MYSQWGISKCVLPKTLFLKGNCNQLNFLTSLLTFQEIVIDHHRQFYLYVFIYIRRLIDILL